MWAEWRRMASLQRVQMAQEERIAQLEHLLAHARRETGQAETRAAAAEKLRLGANLTREEAAAWLGVSTRKLQRMEAAGRLARCPGLGTVVRYGARDVLRLASAK